MSYTNKFTSVNLSGRKLITGDSLGNIVNWNLDAEPVSHEIQGRLGEEILEIYVSGLTTLCRTVNGKIYYWTMHSQTYGAEIGLRIAECELLNTTSGINIVPETDAVGEVIPFDYELSLDLNHPTLRVYGSNVLYLVDIEDGEVSEKFTPDDDEAYEYLKVNGFQFKRGCYIKPGGIMDVESENLIAKLINDCGEEDLKRHEEENPELYAAPPEDCDFENFPTFQGKSIDDVGIYEVKHPRKSLYAFVKLMFDYADYDLSDERNETNNFYYIRIAEISKQNIDYWRECNEQLTDNNYVELDALHDFKIKTTEAVKLSFCEDQLATINQEGNIKIFDIKNKSVLHELKPLPKPLTDEFGEEIF